MTKIQPQGLTPCHSGLSTDDAQRRVCPLPLVSEIVLNLSNSPLFDSIPAFVGSGVDIPEPTGASRRNHYAHHRQAIPAFSIRNCGPSTISDTTSSALSPKLFAYLNYDTCPRFTIAKHSAFIFMAGLSFTSIGPLSTSGTVTSPVK